MTIRVTDLAEWVKAGVPGMLSVVIPAHDEEDSLAATVQSVADALVKADIPHEILVVNDNSRDRTEAILRELTGTVPSLRYVNNPPPNGFGFAVRNGLSEFRGDAVAIMMADGSDSPADLVAFYRKLSEGYECVFGSRFHRNGRLIDYPWPKLILNRLGNVLIQILFLLSYDDMTNAFKMYRRSVIAGLQPLLAHHFNLTVELPLKAIVRGFNYAIVPNSWINRTGGVSKFRIREMGSRYLFIIFYCLLEKWLSREDYVARPAAVIRSSPASVNKDGDRA